MQEIRPTFRFQRDDRCGATHLAGPPHRPSPIKREVKDRIGKRIRRGKFLPGRSRRGNTSVYPDVSPLVVFASG